MSNLTWAACRGHIQGLYLPQYAWRVLSNAEITTLDQLKGVADQVEQLVPGIGPKMAEMIQRELARIAVSEKGRKPGPSS